MRGLRTTFEPPHLTSPPQTGERNMRETPNALATYAASCFGSTSSYFLKPGSFSIRPIHALTLA